MRFLTYEGLAPGDLADKVDKVRAAIERDDLRSPDVKKLGIGDFYRAKLDDGSRLLLQFVTFQGAQACLALEVIRQHAYDRSRFLRGAPVDEAKLALVADGPVADTRPLRYLHPTRTTFRLLDKPLSFDDQQEASLRHRPPMVLVGSAGSGKTALLLQRLRDIPGRVAYVTESRWLAESARGMYLAFDGAPEEQEAEFLSYRQLLETVEVPAGRPVTFRDFTAFFERHRQKIRFADAHQSFEELRGVLTSEPEGPHARDAYLGLGVRQSLFDPEQRALLYDLFERYREWLAASGLYEPNLVAHAWLPRMPPTYDFVAVDEVQDLTNVQLALVLASLKSPGQFVIAGDANQIVHPNFFSWSKVKSLFWRGLDEARDTDVHVLDVSYRNSEAVVHVANRVLKLKHARFGSVDRESNQLMRIAGGPPGAVTCFQMGSSAVRELDEKTRRSTKVAVIVLRDEDKAEARRCFRTPLVFSIHEAKGLEYETVVLFRLVSAERRLFSEIAEGVRPEDLEGDELTYRRAKDKGDKSLDLYKFFVNALYVALTRSVREVFLVEDDVGHPLLRLLNIASSESTAGVQSQRASAEDWQKEAHRLESQGKREQAEAIRTQVLQLTPVPWPVLDRKELPALAERALSPGSVSKKAKQQLFDFAAFHDEPLVIHRLAVEASFELAAEYRRQRVAPTKPYEDFLSPRSVKVILGETERYGVDYRTPMNLTPLMMAAKVANLPLVEALLDRGASREARDHCGRTAMHHALAAAWMPKGGRYATGLLGVVYDLVAPASFDVEVDGKLHQIGREQAEFFFFSAMVARLPELYVATYGRMEGFTTDFFLKAPFPLFPEVVVKEKRRRREYVNHLLARNEPGSTYTPNRKLWVRERRGHYVFNPALRLKVALADGAQEWRPVHDVLNVAWHESHLVPNARGRLVKA